MKKIKQFFINVGFRIKSNPWGFIWRSTLLILAVVFMAVMISSSFTRKTSVNPVSAFAQSSNNVQCPNVEIPDKNPPSYTPPVTDTPDFVVPNPDNPHFTVPGHTIPDIVVPEPPSITHLPNEPGSSLPEPVPPSTPTIPTPTIPTPIIPDNVRPTIDIMDKLSFRFEKNKTVSEFPLDFGDSFEFDLFGNSSYRLALSQTFNIFDSSSSFIFRDIKFVNYYTDIVNNRCFFFRNDIAPYHGFLLVFPNNSFTISDIKKITSHPDTSPSSQHGPSQYSLYVVMPVPPFVRASVNPFSTVFSTWFFSSIFFMNVSIGDVLDNVYQDGYISGYNPGYLDGYNAAYEAGYYKGYDVGSRMSYELGFMDGKDAVRQFYYNAGYRDAYGLGYSSGYNVSFDTAYKQAYKDAYSVGYKKAYSFAYNNAWQNGYSLGSIQSFNTGYLQAYNDTYQESFCKGYELGYNSAPDQSESYSAGYNAGKVAGRNEALTEGLKNPISFVLEPVVTFFNTKLFGVISIGSILSVAIFVAVAIIFLKMFAGG